MRKLATIRRIEEVKPIEGADLIQAYRVDGWWLVDKKGAYQVGDLAIYCEVDSWIPHELAPFLSKGKEPRNYNGVKGERLRTVKLKKQFSQGLLLPIPEEITKVEGMDCTDILGITKWEPEIPAQLAGNIEGAFPPEIPKTDQERIQNINLEEYLDDVYEVTEKLHGSSCTFYLDCEGTFHVYSRNWELKRDPNNSYWKAAIENEVEERMREQSLLGFAIQGELCGAGINGNNYKLGLQFFVFDIFVAGEGYMRPPFRHALIRGLGFTHVPIANVSASISSFTKEELIKDADGLSYLAECRREGFVYKAYNSDKSFKVISNDWLLKND